MPPGTPPLPAPRVRNRAFELALQKHLDDLGLKPELPWFQASDPQEIVDFIRGQQNKYQKASKLHRSVDYWNSKIIEPIRQFFTAVGQGVSSHPEIGGIVWGCIRFIIEVDHLPIAFHVLIANDAVDPDSVRSLTLLQQNCFSSGTYFPGSPFLPPIRYSIIPGL